MDESTCFMSSIVTLKVELKEARYEFESLSKYVKMLTSGMKSLQNFLNDKKVRNDKMGLRFSRNCYTSTKLSTVFIQASSSFDNSCDH